MSRYSPVPQTRTVGPGAVLRPVCSGRGYVRGTEDLSVVEVSWVLLPADRAFPFSFPPETPRLAAASRRG